MQRYFTDKIKNNKVILNEDDSYHLSVVMRAKIDDEVEIVYNNHLYIGKVIKIEDKVTIEIIKEKEDIEEEFHVSIAQALIQDKKMDLVLQKATELGVEEIIPLKTNRSVIKINDKEDKKLLRYERIVKEASSQSKRLHIPKVHRPISIEELVGLDYDIKILCSVNEVSKNIKKVLEKLDISDRILFVVGAEGGFTDYEEELMIKHGFIRVSLSKNVLRTETAPLYILSVVSYNFMR